MHKNRISPSLAWRNKALKSPLNHWDSEPNSELTIGPAHVFDRLFDSSRDWPAFDFGPSEFTWPRGRAPSQTAKMIWEKLALQIVAGPFQRNKHWQRVMKPDSSSISNIDQSYLTARELGMK